MTDSSRPSVKRATTRARVRKPVGEPPPGLDALSFGRATFRLCAERAGPLPPFLGSALRGGIGHSLRKIACLPLCRSVDTCILRDRCAYAYLFETPVPNGSGRLRNYVRLPHPFLIEPPAPRAGPWEAGDELRMQAVLVGRAVDHFPFLVAAVHRMAEEGLGAARIPFSLASVDESLDDGPGKSLWPGPDKTIARLEARPVRVPPAPFSARRTPRVSVRFLTPTRLVAGGRVTSELTFRRLGRSVLSRLSSLLYFHCGRELELDFKGLLGQAEEVRLVRAALVRDSLSRWSNRQQARIRLDGITGEAVFEGEALRAWWPFLAAGQAFHVGKGTVFGLGRYESSVSD